MTVIPSERLKRFGWLGHGGTQHIVEEDVHRLRCPFGSEGSIDATDVGGVARVRLCGCHLLVMVDRIVAVPNESAHLLQPGLRVAESRFGEVVWSDVLLLVLGQSESMPPDPEEVVDAVPGGCDGLDRLFDFEAEGWREVAPVPDPLGPRLPGTLLLSDGDARPFGPQVGRDADRRRESSGELLYQTPKADRSSPPD